MSDFAKQNCIESITVCFVAGHSGGHIIPCLTLASQTQDRVVFVTTNSPLDQAIVQKSPAIKKLYLLDSEQVPYRKPWRLPVALFKFAGSLITSLRLLRRERPAKIITTGGYVAIPVCLAAWMLRIPIELFELNVTPGKTVKLLAPLAQKVSLVFPQTQKFFPKKPCVVTQYPIRFKPHTFDREQVLKELGFSPDRKTLFVLGGSQGSQALNNFIAQWVKDNSHLPVQLIHQVGNNPLPSYPIPAHVFSFTDNLAPYYQLADLVITRAGSGTLAELQHFKTRAIIVPLETRVTDHQLHNAQALQELHPELFTVVRQKDLHEMPIFHSFSVGSKRD